MGELLDEIEEQTSVLSHPARSILEKRQICKGLSSKEQNMATRQYEQELLEQIKNLPAEQVREVLDFAAFLQQNCKARKIGCRKSVSEPPNGWTNAGSVWGRWIFEQLTC